MELKSALLAIALGLIAGTACASQENAIYESRLQSAAAYSDPSFHDIIETSYGYLKPAGKPAADYKDAVADRTAGLIFVTIQPKDKDYTALVEEITASAGFVLYGEQTVRSKKHGTKVQLLGWARADSLGRIFDNPGAAKVYISQRI